MSKRTFCGRSPQVTGIYRFEARIPLGLAMQACGQGRSSVGCSAGFRHPRRRSGCVLALPILRSGILRVDHKKTLAQLKPASKIYLPQLLCLTYWVQSTLTARRSPAPQQLDSRITSNRGSAPRERN